jgi:hypothetical protein
MEYLRYLSFVKNVKVTQITRFSDVNEFTSLLEQLTKETVKKILETDADFTVVDTGSARRATYQERSHGYPDDFDLMVHLPNGVVMNKSIVNKFEFEIANQLKSSGILERIYNNNEVTINCSNLQRPNGRVFAKIDIIPKNHVQEGIGIDISFFTEEMNQGIRYQDSFRRNMIKILEKLPNDQRDNGWKFITETIRTLKAIFKTAGIYSREEGGFRGAGVEQLVMQINKVINPYGTPISIMSLSELKMTFSVKNVLETLINAMFDSKNHYVGIEGFEDKLRLWDPAPPWSNAKKNPDPLKLTSDIWEESLIRFIDIANSYSCDMNEVLTAI